MNRRKMKREHEEATTTTTKPNSIPNPNPNTTKTTQNDCSPSKSKMGCWEEEEDQESAGMDELLAVLGYKVRSSNMADVAQRLEQLEMALGSSSTAQDDLFGSSSTTTTITNTSANNINNNHRHENLSDTVHYNPSDLFGWVQSMLSEVNPDENLAGEYDLRAIPGVAAFPQENSPKRLKIGPPEPVSVPILAEPAGSAIVVVDSQEAGVRLVHTLMACAEAVQQGDMKLADALLKRVGVLAASQPGGAMKKVANHFAEALARRIYSIRPETEIFADQSISDDALHMHFYETCPYLKFAHFTANQAILEAFSGSIRVHVVDFGLREGMQWPALMQALALRPGGPPSFRLTGIGPPQPDGSDALQNVGWKLAQLAESIGVEFEFRGFVASSLSDVEPGLLDLRPNETVAVNAVFELHGLLSRDGAFERVMRSVKSMRPRIVTVVEPEASHNGSVFLDRFTEALHYYSTMFDSLEISPPSEDLLMTEVYLGKQICNVVACEGPDRVERHEPLDRWRDRLDSAGFEPVHLGSNAFKQASMLLALFAGGEGYRVDENNGCLLLGWHNRPLIATSAWRVAESTR